jgi:DnaA-homolog protein
MSDSQIALRLGGPEPSLQNFVVGNNAALLQTLQQLDQGVPTQRMIFWWGEQGSGCTHLLRACRHLGEIIDDCQNLAPSEQQTVFARIAASVSEPHTVMLFAADCPPHELNLRSDLKTRLCQCLVFQVHALSDQDIALALAVNIAERGVSADPLLIDYLLKKVPRNMGVLRAVIDCLDQLSLERKKPISLSLAKEAVAMLNTQRP